MWSEELERHATAFTNEAVKGMIDHGCLIDSHYPKESTLNELYELTWIHLVSNWDAELMENQQTIGNLANDVRKLQVRCYRVVQWALDADTFLSIGGQ